MPFKKQSPGSIIAVDRKGKKARAVGVAELVGALVDSVYGKPETVKDAVALRDKAFKTVASELGLAAKQAKTLHDLLSFYADESEASGYGERFAILKNHHERFGPLPYQVVYFLLRCALSGSYKKVSKRDGRFNSENHPDRLNRQNFINWLSVHKKKGANPEYVSEIKKLEGFKKWGVDSTLRGWYSYAGFEPPLKKGRPKKRETQKTKVAV